MKMYNERYKLPVIAVYVGRFQPMGVHHLETYKDISSIFGENNTYVVTSDKVKLPKSPLNFEEKKSIAIAHGIDPNYIVKARSGYQPKELHEKLARERGLELDDFVIVFVVGQKDMLEDPRFNDLGGMTKPTKRNPIPRLKYLQEYDPNNLRPALEHGYVYTIPTVEYYLPNGEMSSGTKLRQFLFNASPDEFEEAMGFFDSKIYELLRQKFDPGNINILEYLEEGRKRKPKKGTLQYSRYLEDIMDELQYIKSGYESRKKSGARYRKEAAKIQDAYSELRRLKRKNDKMLLSTGLLSEQVIAKAVDTYDNKSHNEFTRFDLRSFLSGRKK